MKLINIIGLILILAAVVIVFYLRFTNIDMSDTRLIITYWKEYLLTILLIILGIYLGYIK